MVLHPVKPSELETPNISIGEFLLQYYRKRAADGKTALIWADKGLHISYGELLRDAVRVATGLQAMGAKCGDKLSIVCRNSPELFAITVGAFFAGLAIVPSIPEFSAPELQSNFEVAKPRYIIVQAENASVVREAISGIAPRPEIIVLDESSYKDILEKGSHANPDSFQTAKIQDPSQHEFGYYFSSGTTGRQKAISQVDFNFIRNCFLSMASVIKHRGPFLCTSQMHWASNLYVLCRCVIADRTFIFATNTDLNSVINHIHKYKPESFISAPSMLYLISNAIEQHPGRWDLSSLKAVFSVGDRLGAANQRQLSEKLNVKIYQEYGSSEQGFVTSADLSRDPVYGSVGTPIIGLRLVNPDTEEEITEKNQVGEIRTKPIVTNGYLNEPEKTAEAFDSQGWFKSGDLGYFDEDNQLFIVDRIKEMLKYQGYQVAPGELEDIIKEMPEVADVAVGGKQHDFSGSLITALVVKKPGWNVTEEDVKNFLEKKNLHDSKRLRGGVVFVEKLPKNINGKIERRSVAKMLNPTK